MGEWGEKGSEELFILFVCSKSFFPTPVGKDKCMQLLEPEVAEFHMDLNGRIIIVSWELIRPHNRNKPDDMQCWRSQQRKQASHRNNGCNLPGHCHSSARITTSTWEAESNMCGGNPVSQWGKSWKSFQHQGWIAKQIILFCHSECLLCCSYLWGLLFSPGTQTALEVLLVSTDHQFPILEVGEFQRWKELLRELIVRCLWLKAWETIFLWYWYSVTVDCFMLPQLPPHACL